MYATNPIPPLPLPLPLPQQTQRCRRAMNDVLMYVMHHWCRKCFNVIIDDEQNTRREGFTAAGDSSVLLNFISKPSAWGVCERVAQQAKRTRWLPEIATVTAESMWAYWKFVSHSKCIIEKVTSAGVEMKHILNELITYLCVLRSNKQLLNVCLHWNLWNSAILLQKILS